MAKKVKRATNRQAIQGLEETVRNLTIAVREMTIKLSPMNIAEMTLQMRDCQVSLNNMRNRFEAVETAWLEEFAAKEKI